MNENERKAIRARVEAASQAPWRENIGVRIIDGADNIVLITDADYWSEDRPGFVPIDEDMAFIAAARTDVPALLDENDRLREALEYMLASHDSGMGDRINAERIARAALNGGTP